MYTKQEILDKMKKARSWRELQIDIKDVLNVFEEDKNEERDNQITELQQKIERLTETNRQLRSENKALRAGK